MIKSLNPLTCLNIHSSSYIPQSIRSPQFTFLNLHSSKYIPQLAFLKLLLLTITNY